VARCRRACASSSPGAGPAPTRQSFPLPHRESAYWTGSSGNAPAQPRTAGRTARSARRPAPHGPASVTMWCCSASGRDRPRPSSPARPWSTAAPEAKEGAARRPVPASSTSSRRRRPSWRDRPPEVGVPRVPRRPGLRSVDGVERRPRVRGAGQCVERRAKRVAVQPSGEPQPDPRVVLVPRAFRSSRNHRRCWAPESGSGTSPYRKRCPAVVGKPGRVGVPRAPRWSGRRTRLARRGHPKAADSGEDPEAQDGVPAELEEVVLGPDLLPAQHVGPDCRQCRSASVRGAAYPEPVPPLQAPEAWAVQLSVPD